MSIWQHGSVAENPYLRTPFRVAMLPREVVRRASLVQRIGQARSIATANPRANSIRGSAVSLAEVNDADEILLKPERRILAELLVHATETPPLSRVRALARKAASDLARPDDDTPTGIDCAKLKPLLVDLVGHCLDGMEPAEPSFGALETTLVPPFGQRQEE